LKTFLHSPKPLPKTSRHLQKGRRKRACLLFLACGNRDLFSGGAPARHRWLIEPNTFQGTIGYALSQGLGTGPQTPRTYPMQKLARKASDPVGSNTMFLLQWFVRIPVDAA